MNPVETIGLMLSILLLWGRIEHRFTVLEERLKAIEKNGGYFQRRRDT